MESRTVDISKDPNVTLKIRNGNELKSLKVNKVAWTVLQEYYANNPNVDLLKTIQERYDELRENPYFSHRATSDRIRKIVLISAEKFPEVQDSLKIIGESKTKKV